VSEDKIFFPFTKKKFLRLQPVTRHKWLINWLTKFYQRLITNRINPEIILLFSSEYLKVLQWLNLSFKKISKSNNNRAWVEYVSDAIHFHRLQAGISPKDHDLLNYTQAKINNSDGLQNNIQPLDYHVALDRFRSLFNIGAMYRISDAAGFNSIILGHSPGSENASVKKTAMGAEKWIKSKTTNDFATTLIGQKEEGYKIIGIETIKDSINYNDFQWPRKAVIVFGNEEYGISRHILRICDHFVHIPMYGRKNSINVANAASVIMFHIAGKLRNNSGTAK